jgi:hypothetical protein
MLGSAGGGWCAAIDPRFVPPASRAAERARVPAGVFGNKTGHQAAALPGLGKARSAAPKRRSRMSFHRSSPRPFFSIKSIVAAICPRVNVLCPECRRAGRLRARLGGRRRDSAVPLAGPVRDHAQAMNFPPQTLID